MSKAYKKLEQHYSLIGKLAGANALLMWDRSVVMPLRAAPAHGEIAGALAHVCNEKATAPEIAELLAGAEAKVGELDPWQAANLHEMRRVYTHATAVPTALAVRKAEVSAALNQSWIKARNEDDFNLFAPGMREMLAINREIAARKSEALDLAPYDALMDEADPGLTCEIVDRVFNPLAESLPDLLEKILARQADWNPLPLNSAHPVAAQQELSEWLVRQIGYPMDHGRIDSTTHPFAMAHVPGDQRIATCFKEGNLGLSIMATIHETGHSMYEFNLPKEWNYQPVGLARGATLHESQAIMLDMMASRSHEFIEFLAPHLANRFGGNNVAAYTAPNLCQHFHRVRRNLIRLEADEVVYPLHVILRYRLERELMDGQLEVEDIPEAWNDKMKALIGITPPSDASGCLQDIHWSVGLFAYFPNYALGEAAAAQLFQAACNQSSDLLEGLRRGDFEPYFNWVRPKIHQRASSASIDDIIESATGHTLGADALLSHLRNRYLN